MSRISTSGARIVIGCFIAASAYLLFPLLKEGKTSEVIFLGGANLLFVFLIVNPHIATDPNWKSESLIGAKAIPLVFLGFALMLLSFL